MSGRDEKTRIEALESPGSRKMPRATKRHRKNRGMPPPATFDIDTLPDSSNLTALEAAAVIRRTPGALEQWRRNPNHPLKWRYVDGRQRGCTNGRVNEPQIARRHFCSETFLALFHRSVPLLLVPWDTSRETQETDHKPFPPRSQLCCAPREKFTKGTAGAYKI